METWTPYCGAGPSPAEAWERWNLDPLLLAALAVAAAGLWILTPTRRALSIAAVAVLALSFVSPLCALSSALFSARTLHHVLLTSLAAPLLAWSLPRSGSSRQLAPASLAFAAVFWLWHAPAFYAAALTHDGVYWSMQASLLASATMFWRAVRTATALAGVAALLATTVQMGLLGALLSFMPRALYAPHALTTAAWGMSPLDDQQLAGLIMWIPAAGAYLAAALVLLGRQLRRPAGVAAR
jgi:putative membrane protein